jgi:hypothetical protein
MSAATLGSITTVPAIASPRLKYIAKDQTLWQ